MTTKRLTKHSFQRARSVPHLPFQTHPSSIPRSLAALPPNRPPSDLQTQAPLLLPVLHFHLRTP